MNRFQLTASTLALTVSSVALGATSTASAAGEIGPPATYGLQGDPGVSKFEGIGVSPNGSTFYVSEVTGGELHRGDVRSGEMTEWQPEGADGRFTARGITPMPRGGSTSQVGRTASAPAGRISGCMPPTALSSPHYGPVWTTPSSTT